MERASNNKTAPFKLKSPLRQSKPKVKITTGFGPEADKRLADKVNVGRGSKKKVAKKTAGKIVKQVGKRLLGPVGVALTAYDAMATVPKVVKATQKHLKTEAKERSTKSAQTLFRGPKY